jgi:hypothetical protein
MDKIPIPNDYREFLRSLKENQVDFLITGAYASKRHAFPRPTGDLQIWVAQDGDSIRRTLTAVSDFGCKVDAEIETRLMEGDTVLRLGVPPLRIEVITHSSNRGFHDSYAMRSTAWCGDIEVNLDDLENLPE